jgi:hypothetical protein
MIFMLNSGKSELILAAIRTSLSQTHMTRSASLVLVFAKLEFGAFLVP